MRGREEGGQEMGSTSNISSTCFTKLIAECTTTLFSLITKAKAPMEGLNGFSLHLEKNVSVCQLLSEIGVTFDATQLLVIHSYEVSATSLTIFKSRIIV